MKKSLVVLFCFSLFCLLGAGHGVAFGKLYGQGNSLLDVNYDKPESTTSYSKGQEEFQQIYLQYEEAIKNIENKIRAEEVANKLAEIERVKKVERDNYLAEIEKIRKQESENASDAIDEARKNIYENEVKLVREQETAKLTEEITADVTARLTADFEKQKNDEVERIRKQLKKEISQANHSTTERFRIVAPYIFGLIILFVIVLWGIKVVDKKKFKNHLKNHYITILKSNSEKIAKDEIADELKKTYGKSRILHEAAYREALNEYKKIEKLFSVEECKENIGNHIEEIEKTFSKWNKICDCADFGTLNELCDRFENCKGQLGLTGAEIVNSFGKRDSGDISDLKEYLKAISKRLVDFSESIKALKNNIPEDIANKMEDKLENISKKYSSLANQFSRGVFNE